MAIVINEIIYLQAYIAYIIGEVLRVDYPVIPKTYTLNRMFFSL